MIPDEKKRLIKNFAKQGKVIINIPCAIGCKFCYQRNMRKIIPPLPWCEISKYDEESFNLLYSELKKQDNGMEFTSKLFFDNDGITFGPLCDHFETGFTVDQIDKLLSLVKKNVDFYCLYTTGRSLDLGTIKYLKNRHPRFLHFWLSIITFNDDLKKKLICNYTPTKKVIMLLKELFEYTHNSMSVLMMITFEQTLEDLKILTKLNPQGHDVLILNYSYDKLHPEFIKKLLEQGHKEFRKLIFYIVEHPNEFKNITGFRFDTLPECCPWVMRQWLRQVLSDSEIKKTDMIVCSEAAYEMIKYELGHSQNIFPVPTRFGGSVNFATGVLTRDIASLIRKLLNANKSFKRVILPTSFWCVGDKFDYEGKTKEWLKKEFPQLDFVFVEVPKKVLALSLSLLETYEFFNCDLKSSKQLRSNKDVYNEFINKCLDSLDSATKASLIRSFYVLNAESFLDPIFNPKNEGVEWISEDSDIVFDSKLFSGVLEKDIPVHVTYFEPILENSKNLLKKKNIAVVFNGKKRFLTKSKLKRIKLDNYTSKLMFYKLFIEGRDLNETVDDVLDFFGLDSKQREKILAQTKDFYTKFKNLEY